jgi:acetoin utilization deacetylase AcuC-like enzyme
MTSKLQTLAPVLVVLEGGYNLKSISLAAESVLCALIGKEGPRETTLKHSEMKDRCWLPQYYH